MAYFQWNDKYSVQIDSIDQQHKKLVDLINNLEQGVDENNNQNLITDTLYALIDYATYHFNYEEELFCKYNYPDKDNHAKRHDDMALQFISLKERFEKGDQEVPKEILPLLKNWLADHILREDKNYIRFFKDNGVE